MLLFALIPFIFIIIRTYIQLFVCVVLNLGVRGRRGVEGGGRERVGRKWVGARGGGAGACLGYYRG